MKFANGELCKIYFRLNRGSVQLHYAMILKPSNEVGRWYYVLCPNGSIEQWHEKDIKEII